MMCDCPGLRQLANSRTPKDGLPLGWARVKAVRVDPEDTDLRFERRARDAGPRRRARWPEHTSPARAQRILDDRLLLCGQPARQGQPAVGGRRGRQRALVDRELVAVGHDHRPLDDVLPLAHIDEVLDEHGNVLSSIAQRRHLQRKHVQPIEELLEIDPSGRAAWIRAGTESTSCCGLTRAGPWSARSSWRTLVRTTRQCGESLILCDWRPMRPFVVLS